jgi:HAD superfamily hydrolase (TIGR01490 family)
MAAKVALFDFDGTVTQKDTLIAFIRYAVGDAAFVKGLLLLLPMLTAYKLKLVPNYRAKERLLAHFFKGMDAKVFQMTAKRFAEEKIDNLVRPAAMERINWHRKEGHRIIVVTASAECWVAPWCQQHEIETIGTKLEVKDGKLTGRFATFNCYGEEKVRRLQKHYDMKRFSYIYAYGDSKGDKALLALADEAFYKPFR